MAKTVLAIGAHYDDCVFGIPGVMLQAVRKHYKVVILSVIGDYTNWAPVKGREKEFVKTVTEIGKVFGVMGAAASAALGVVKLYRVVKQPPGKDRDPDDELDRRSEPPRPGGMPWFVWPLAAALAVLLLGLVLLVVGVRLGKVQPHEVIEKPDAQKVKQARERLQFREGVPITARNLHEGMWDLMYSGIIQREYGGKVILVAGPVSDVSADSITLEAGPFPASLTCSFGVRYRDRIKTLREGQLVTIRAEIQTYKNWNDGEVLNLVECESVSAEGGEKADPKRPR